MIATPQAPRLSRSLHGGTGCATLATTRALFRLAAALLVPREPEDRSASADPHACPHPDRCTFCGCNGNCLPPPAA